MPEQITNPPTEERTRPTLRQGIGHLGTALSKAAAAYGTGITGVDYLSQFQEAERMRAERAEIEQRRQKASKGFDLIVESVEDPEARERLENLRPFLSPDDKLKILSQSATQLSGTREEPFGRLADVMGLMMGVDVSTGPDQVARQQVERSAQPDTPVIDAEDVDVTPRELRQEPTSIDEAMRESEVPARKPQILKPGARIGGMEIVNVADFAEKQSIQQQMQNYTGQLAKFAGGLDVERQRSAYNLEFIGGTFYDFLTNMANAYDEESIGSLMRELRTSIGGFLGGDWDVDVGEGLALRGKRFELVLNMFPMFTQQIGKEGSIRLIESVLRQIQRTLPSDKASPSTARKFLRNTLMSLYRKQRGISRMLGREGGESLRAPLPGESQKDYERRMDEFVQTVHVMGEGLIIEGDELEALNNFIDTALSPLDRHIRKEQGIDDIESEAMQLLQQIRGN